MPLDFIPIAAIVRFICLLSLLFTLYDARHTIVLRTVLLLFFVRLTEIVNHKQLIRIEFIILRFYLLI